MMQGSNKEYKESIWYLDLVKVVAVLMIMLFHYVEEIKIAQLLQNPDAFKFGSISLLNLGGVNLTLSTWAYSLAFIMLGAYLVKRYEEGIDRNLYFKKCAGIICPTYYVAFLVAFVLKILLVQRLEMVAPLWTLLLTILGIDGYLGDGMPTFAMVGDWFVGAMVFAFLLFPLMNKLIKKNPHKTLVVLGGLFLVWGFFYPLDFNKTKDVLIRSFEVFLGMYLGMFSKKVSGKFFGGLVILIGIIFGVRLPGVCFFVLSSLAGAVLFLMIKYMAAWIEKTAVKKIISWLAAYAFPTFLIHHFLLNRILEFIPEKSLNVPSMAVLLLFVFGITWAVGIGIQKIEAFLRGLQGYEITYTKVIEKSLVIMAVVLFIARLTWMAFTQIPTFDGSMNYQISVSLLKEGLYATTYDGGHLFAGRIQTGAPFLVPLAILFKIFGIGISQALMLNVVYAALMLMFIWLIMKEQKVNNVAFIWLLGLLILLWHFMELALGGYGEIPALALLLGMVYFLMKAEKGNGLLYGISGVFFGLAYLTKTVILIAVPAMVVVFGSKLLIEKKCKIKNIIQWGLGGVVPVLCFEFYKYMNLGTARYIASGNNQYNKVLQQAGVAPGLKDTPNLFEKVEIHLSAFEYFFGMDIAVLLVLLFVNFGVFAYLICKRKKLEYMDIIELVVYSYFGWWILIIPTQRAVGRRIIIGLILLFMISCMKSVFFAEWLTEAKKVIISKKNKALIATVVAALGIIFISFGNTVYNSDERKGVIEIAEIVEQKVEEENAIICGKGWWQAPTIAFQADVPVEDLEKLNITNIEVPIYFVADTNWINDSGETVNDLPYPVELIYEEKYTGQRIYRIIGN